MQLKHIGFAGLLLVFAPSPILAFEFNYDNLLLAWMKLDEDFSYSTRDVESYMRLFRPRVWQEVRNNEFRLNERREETLQMMKRAVEAFDYGQTVTLETSMTLGDYDFDRKAFPIREMSGDRYWYPRARYPRGTFPSRLSVSFSNTDKLSFLPMEVQHAANFVEARTTRSGNVDRRVYVNIEFRIQGLKNHRPSEFEAEIVSATVFSDSQRTRVITTFAEISDENEKASRLGQGGSP